MTNKGQFAKGQIPWNKGTHFDNGAVATRFKPGSIPPNHKPVGSIRACSKDGYLYIKVAEGLYQYKLLHREIWKQHHGEYPPKGSALIFKDGNKKNCDIENLECLTRKQLMDRNTIHNYPEEIKELTRLRAVITRKINGN